MESALRKINVLGAGVTVCTYGSAIEEIVRLARERTSAAVTACAVHLIMESYYNRELRERLSRFHIVTPDGQPVRWALNLLGGAGLNERVYGPELTFRLCQRAAKENLKVFFYGSTEAVVSTMKRRMEEKIPGLNVVGTKPSWFRDVSGKEDQEDIDAINNSGAHILFVGLGCPRQEHWAFEHIGKVNAVMLAVGAAFDFHAGSLAQAPPWMQKRGLEWLFRLFREPKRLWRRYVILNPLYLSLLFMQWMGLRTFPGGKEYNGHPDGGGK